MSYARPSRLPATAVLIAALVCAWVPAFAQDREIQRELMLTATFDAAGRSLLIDVADADVIVRSGTGDQITFEVWLSSRSLPDARERYERMEFRADAGDGVVSLRSSDAENIWENWDWRRWGGFDMVVEATVPATIDARVVSADGDISVQSLAGNIVVIAADGDVTADRITGTIHLETEDGDVGIRGVSGDRLVASSADGDLSARDLEFESIELHTADGDIHAKRVAGDTIDARTDEGDIIVDAVAGPLAAQTKDGDIHISIERLEDTSLRTNDGDITIRATESLSAELDLRGYELSMRSDVRFDGVFNGRLDRSVIEGSLNGGGPALRARTGEGTIVLRLQGN